MIIIEIYTSIIILSTVTNLKMFCDTHNIFVDGIFSSCLKFFHQIIIVYRFVDNKAYKSLIFGILGKK
jgi:hypothetical protein